MKSGNGVRGSTGVLTRLFTETPSDAELAKMIDGARADYVIRRWEQLGTPALDQILATVEVPFDKVGDVLAELTQERQPFSLKVVDGFAIGTPRPDTMLFNLRMERRAGSA